MKIQKNWLKILLVKDETWLCAAAQPAEWQTVSNSSVPPRRCDSQLLWVSEMTLWRTWHPYRLNCELVSRERLPLHRAQSRELHHLSHSVPLPLAQLSRNETVWTRAMTDLLFPNPVRARFIKICKHKYDQRRSQICYDVKISRGKNCETLTSTQRLYLATSTILTSVTNIRQLTATQLRHLFLSVFLNHFWIVLPKI